MPWEILLILSSFSLLISREVISSAFEEKNGAEGNLPDVAHQITSGGFLDDSLGNARRFHILQDIDRRLRHQGSFEPGRRFGHFNIVMIEDQGEPPPAFLQASE